MRFILSLFVLGALPTLALAVETAYSPPVGGTQITFSTGSRYTGMSFVNPALLRGTVTATSGSTLVIASAGTNLGSALASGVSYYLEFISGSPATYIGDRFEVDVAATQASANNTVSVTLGADDNTLPALPSMDGLSAYTVVVRPHVTLGQLFGTKSDPLMQGSASVASADQVLFYNARIQSFETYYFLRNASGSVAQWTKVGGGSSNRDNLVIPPGAGMVVVRNAPSPVTLRWSGQIRFNNFSQPLVAGNNLVAQPFPVDASPASRAMTFASGLTGATSVATADKIQFPENGIFKTYYLLRNASGSVEQWTLVGGGSTNRSNETLFPLSGAAFINKFSSDFNYLVPSTLTL